MNTEQDLKRKVRTARDLHSVVKTMKALAAVSIRQYEEAVAALSDYCRCVELGLQAVLMHAPHAPSRGRLRAPRRRGVIVFGSDHGMCGALNDQIVSYAAAETEALEGERDDHLVLAVGARIAGRMEEAGRPAEEVFPVPTSAPGITSMVQDVLLKIDEWHGGRDVDRIDLFYSRRVFGAASEPVTVHLMPIDMEWLDRVRKRPWPTHRLPTFSMDRSSLFSALTREYLFVSVYRAFAESLASENASRLASMQGAERNIEERIDELTGQFHQQRQMTITEELLDIAAGYEALTRESRA